MIDWASIETALVRLIQAKLGLADPLVRWANQNLATPKPGTALWVSLSRSDLTQSNVMDGVFQGSAAGTPPVGAEIVLRVMGWRSFMLEVQAFTRNTVLGNNAAYAILSRLEKQLQLPSSTSTLSTAGVALMQIGPTRSLDDLQDTAYEGRATLELTCSVADHEDETTTYIQQVTGELDLAPETTPIPLSLAV